MAVDDLDLTALEYEELVALEHRVTRERQRRFVVENTEQHVADLEADYLNAVGRKEGTEWEQPTGAHDAYPKGWIVTWKGKRWESLRHGNPHEPGVSAWREVPEDPDEVPLFVQPTGAHDAYQEGDRVVYNLITYESVINDNVWSPDDHPQGWHAVTQKAKPVGNIPLSKPRST